MVDSSNFVDEKGLGTDRQNASPNARTVLGRHLAELADATWRLAAELRPMLDNDAAAALNKLVQDAEHDACRIAVIGQVKAGKSTLINALIRRPGFLPADVNPWTAAVTKMHFGRPSDAGAVYQFFDEADWQHLAGGGRLLELSQRLGVALDEEMLANQVQLMRERAEQRLGQQFRQLLGKQHRFESASAEVLERYVCIGDRGPALKIGRFADITKSADLYFELSPFAYPTTVIDTPGTNDPFLVRDALSREAFKSADAYIVVLNAQQALSSSDLDLLRLLQGLEKSRLVIFINRVDLLPNPAEDGEIVTAHVRSKLVIEFPDIPIPVVAGSALWAESEMTSAEGIAAATPDRAADALTRRKALLSKMPGGAAIPQTMRASGLDNLSEILSRLVDQGPAMLRLQRRQNALRDMVAKVDFTTRSKLLSLQQRISSARDDETAKARRQAKAADDLQRLNAASEAVTRLVEAASSDLGSAKDSATKRLSGALHDIIRRHAATARETLLARQHFSRHDHIWHFPTLPLRRDLERAFQAIYKEAAAQLGQIERTANAGILKKIGDLLPADGLLGEDSPIYIIDPEPSIGALGKTVAIELDDQWRAWWRLWHGQKQRARKLEELLIAEFDPVVEALVDAADAELDAHVVILVQRFSQLNRDLVAILNRLKDDVDAASHDVMTTAQDALNQEYQRSQQELEQRRQDCIRIAGALRLLIGRGATLGPANPAA